MEKGKEDLESVTLCLLSSIYYFILLMVPSLTILHSSDKRIEMYPIPTTAKMGVFLAVSYSVVKGYV
jgi:hypothetical protein